MNADAHRAPRKGSRRDEIIDLAADILREGGPGALTSVSVARRAGITQSSVYRHVDNMEELAALASERVLNDLAGALAATVVSTDIDRHAASDISATDISATDISAIAGRVIAVMQERSTTYEVIDRWQFVDGPLGEAVRSVVDDACASVAALLEHGWRRESGWDGPLDDEAAWVQIAHARSFQADGHSVARVLRTTDDPEIRTALTAVLTSRMICGWHAYVTDMQQRTGAAGPAAPDGGLRRR